MMRKEKFSDQNENCQKNVSDPKDSLLTSSRRPDQPQKRPDDRTLNTGVAVQTAGDCWQTTDAADEQCLRCGRSSPSCTAVPCAADINGPWNTACTAPTEERPATAACRAVDW